MFIVLTMKSDHKSPIILLGSRNNIREGACAYLCLDPNKSFEEHKEILEYLKRHDPENVEIKTELPA